MPLLAKASPGKDRLKTGPKTGTKGDLLKKIQAVFWDCDNTLLATAEAHWKKHQTLLKKKGFFLEEKQRERIYQNNGAQNFAWIEKEFALDLCQEDYLRAVDLEFEKQHPFIEKRPGVDQMLQWLYEKKIPQALVTNARKRSCEPLLIAKGIAPYLVFALFQEDTNAGKPDPTPYLRALEKMRSLLKEPLEPSRVLAIEDSPEGVESAFRAGLRVIQRKYRKEDPLSPFAESACFEEKDFLDLIQKSIEG